MRARLIEKKGRSGVAKAAVVKPKRGSLVTGYVIKLTKSESKVFLTDDGSPPAAALIEAGRRNVHLLQD